MRAPSATLTPVPRQALAWPLFRSPSRGSAVAVRGDTSCVGAEVCYAPSLLFPATFLSLPLPGDCGHYHLLPTCVITGHQFSGFRSPPFGPSPMSFYTPVPQHTASTEAPCLTPPRTHSDILPCSPKVHTASSLTIREVRSHTGPLGLSLPNLHMPETPY